ncbi:internal scaffolding protein [Apis mellifera associated microvirus 30]|nr:internal scaffolding protein [Apis mellifera associated microvirus 30]
MKHEILLTNGEIKLPALQKRARHYADLDYTNTEVQQHFKDECDINNIVKRLGPNGLAELIKIDPKQYGDFSEVPTYQESLLIVSKAQAQFDALPADLRDRFSNDPAKFLEFTSNKENLPEMIKLGLATERIPNPPSDLEILTNELKRRNDIDSKKESKPSSST